MLLTLLVSTLAFAQAPELVQLPEGAEPQTYKLNAILNGQTSYEQEVQVVLTDEEAYINGVCSYLPNAWIKGTVKEDTITFAKDQYLGQVQSNAGALDIYLTGLYTENNNLYISDATTFILDEETGVLTAENWYGSYFVYGEGNLQLLDYFANAVLTPGEVTYEAVELPMGLVPEEYVLKGEAYNLDPETKDLAWSTYATTANVAFGIGDIYIQGLSSQFPEAWVKGTFDGENAIIPSGQYLGSRINNLTGQEVNLFLSGTDGTNFCDIAFAFDEETGVLTTQNQYYVTEKANSTLAWSEQVRSFTLEPFVDETGVPLAPIANGFSPYDPAEGYGSLGFKLSMTGEEGKILVAEYLFYQLYTEKDGVQEVFTFKPEDYLNFTEEMTMIPYTYTDGMNFLEQYGTKLIYLNFPTADYDRFGVMAIYTGGGETNSSPITWFGGSNGISDAAHLSQQAANGKQMFDLQGRRVENPTRGLYIVNGKKVFVK